MEQDEAELNKYFNEQLGGISFEPLDGPLQEPNTLSYTKALILEIEEFLQNGGLTEIEPDEVFNYNALHILYNLLSQESSGENTIYEIDLDFINSLCVELGVLFDNIDFESLQRVKISANLSQFLQKIPTSVILLQYLSSDFYNEVETSAKNGDRMLIQNRRLSDAILVTLGDAEYGELEFIFKQHKQYKNGRYKGTNTLTIDVVDTFWRFSFSEINRATTKGGMTLTEKQLLLLVSPDFTEIQIAQNYYTSKTNSPVYGKILMFRFNFVTCSYELVKVVNDYYTDKNEDEGNNPDTLGVR